MAQLEATAMARLEAEHQVPRGCNCSSGTPGSSKYNSESAESSDPEGGRHAGSRSSGTPGASKYNSESAGSSDPEGSRHTGGARAGPRSKAPKAAKFRSESAIDNSMAWLETSAEARCDRLYHSESAGSSDPAGSVHPAGRMHKGAFGYLATYEAMQRVCAHKTAMCNAQFARWEAEDAALRSAQHAREKAGDATPRSAQPAWEEPEDDEFMLPSMCNNKALGA